MPKDETLNATLRAAIGDHPGLGEKNMMGGTCFFVNGNMLGGAHREKDGTGLFMFRVGKANAARADAVGGGRVVELNGRRMGGMYFVEADDCAHDRLTAWVDLALGHALSLPPKEKK